MTDTITNDIPVVTINDAAKELCVTLQRVQRIVTVDESYGLHTITRRTKTGERTAQVIPRSELPRLAVELTEREQKRKQSVPKRSDLVPVVDVVTIPRTEFALMQKINEEKEGRIREQSETIAEQRRTIEELRRDKERMIAEKDIDRPKRGLLARIFGR